MAQPESSEKGNYFGTKRLVIDTRFYKEFKKRTNVYVLTGKRKTTKGVNIHFKKHLFEYSIVLK